MKKRKDPKNRVLKEGEGYKIQNDKIMYYYCFRDADGKRKFIYSTDLSQLRDKEKRAQRDLLNGMRYSGTSTVNTFYEKWVMTKRGLKENTFRNYQYMYKTFVMDTIGKTMLKDLTRSKIKQFYIKLVEKDHLKVRTVETIHSVLYQVLQLAVDDDCLRANLAANGLNELKKTVVRDDEKRMALSVAEEKAFRKSLDENKNSWFKPMYLAMLDTGLRVGELTGLRWCDIDLENGLIDVNHTLVYFDKGYNPETNKKCHYAINTPKTKSSNRIVPMTSELLHSLRELKKLQEENGLRCETVVDGYSDFAFFNQMSTVYNQATLNKAIRRIRRDYNLDRLEELENGKIKEEDMTLIPSFSCHVLRHTAATRLCESGVNTRFIMDMLGHADIRTTMNIYVDVTKDFKKSELEKFEKYTKQSV